MSNRDYTVTEAIFQGKALTKSFKSIYLFFILFQFKAEGF